MCFIKLTNIDKPSNIDSINRSRFGCDKPFVRTISGDVGVDSNQHPNLALQEYINYSNFIVTNCPGDVKPDGSVLLAYVRYQYISGLKAHAVFYGDYGRGQKDWKVLGYKDFLSGEADIYYVDATTGNIKHFQGKWAL